MGFNSAFKGLIEVSIHSSDFLNVSILANKCYS
jgi:hypothetical protein